MLSNLPRSVFPINSGTRLSEILGIDKLTLLEVAKTIKSHYSSFDQYQEKGEKWRHIDSTSKILKKIQKRINKRILRPVIRTLPDGMIGGVIDRSLKDNGIPHIHQEIVVRIDLKNCFPNTTDKTIFRVWRSYLGCGEKTASLLTRLTTFERRLPQGASTSPSLCNLALLPLFSRIKNLALTNGFQVTLFVDDITISGSIQIVLNAIGPIIGYIHKNGHAIRNKKINKMPQNTKQITTGMILNKNLGVESSKVEEIRRLILQQSHKTKVSKQIYDTIIGKIQQVKSLSDSQGEKLLKLSEMILPRTIDFSPKSKNTKREKCLSSKLCRAKNKKIFHK